MTPPNALRFAADLLDNWAKSGDDQTLVHAFVDICMIHDSMLDRMQNHPQYAGVLKERENSFRAYSKLTEERDAAVKRAEQAEVQLAGCGAAALGAIAPHAEEAQPGDYGYSASYAEVIKIRRELEALREGI